MNTLMSIKRYEVGDKMQRVKIFEPCDMEYEVYDKPVRYNEAFLKELANHTVGCILVEEEHRGKGIGNVTNVTFTDGELMADISTGNSLDNLKYSPSFDCTLVDNGDHWLATNGKLLEVALTSKPRQAILNNTGDGGSTMADKNNDGTIEFFQNEVKRLQKENNKLEFQLNQANEKIEGFKEKETELEELRGWKETNEKLIEEQKPIVEKYKEQQKKAHDELLEKASQGDEAVKEKLKNFSTDDLETIIGLQSETQPAQGVGTENAPGLNEGTGETSEEAEAKERREAVKSMFPELEIE